MSTVASPGRLGPHPRGPRAPAPGPADDWAVPRPWPVSVVCDEAPDVVTVGFTPPAPFRFQPGQFNMLSVPGIGEVPISISGDPADGTTVLHTIRDVGLVTKALCGLRPGQRAGVRGPYGTSWPLAAAEHGDLVIVAGGIGLPPLRPALYQALHDRDRFGRITLLYGARTRPACCSPTSSPPGGTAAWTSGLPSTRPGGTGPAASASSPRSSLVPGSARRPPRSWSARRS